MTQDAQAQFTRLDDTFYCEAKKAAVSLEECLDGFVNAGAFHLTSSVCHGCKQGANNRQTFANSAELIDEDTPKAVLIEAFRRCRIDKQRRRSPYTVMRLIG